MAKHQKIKLKCPCCQKIVEINTWNHYEILDQFPDVKPAKPKILSPEIVKPELINMKYKDGIPAKRQRKKNKK